MKNMDATQTQIRNQATDYSYFISKANNQLNIDSVIINTSKIDIHLGSTDFSKKDNNNVDIYRQDYKQ